MSGAVYIYFKMWMWILIGLNSITKLCGYSNGVFPEVCGSMTPNHEYQGQPTPPQTTESPFEVVILPSTSPGEPVTVILKSKGSEEFKGFMLEAREFANENRLTGKFILLNSQASQLLSCGDLQDSAVSHTSNNRMKSIQFSWTATEAEQDITFRATFLMSYSKFWIGVNNTLFKTTTTTTTSQPTTTSQTTTTTTTTSQPTTTTTSQTTTTTTTTTSQPTTTTTTSRPTNTTNTFNKEEKAAIALMCFDSVLIEGEMAIANIAKILLASEAFFHRLNEVSKIAGNILCVAIEISSMILLCMGDSCNVTLIALVCVVTVINFAEIVIVSLAIACGPEVKKSCNIAVVVCFVIHEIFTVAVIFLGVMKNDGCGNNVTDSWLLKVMIAFTVWDFLLIIWVVMLGTKRRDSSHTNKRNKHLHRWKSLRVAEMINISVGVVLIAGAISFPVAVIVALFTCQKN